MRREVKIIENKHILLTQFDAFDLVPYLLDLFIFRTLSFCFHYRFWTGKYRLRRLSKMKDLCHFHFNPFTSSFQTFSTQGGVFSIFQFMGDTTLFWVTILEQTCHCAKRVRFLSYSSLHFFAFGLNTERYFSIFSPNAGKWNQNNSKYEHFFRSVQEENTIFQMEKGLKRSNIFNGN